MWPLKYSTVFIYAVFIIRAALGQENTENKYGAIGRKVSFGPASLTPPVSSIAWKQSSSSGGIVKAIEWDGDEPDVKQRFTILNSRFKDITTLNEKTGYITITNLNANHAGTYILEINSKEQEQRFKLEVMPPVPKPEIIIERINSDTVYLECRYNDTIIWKNSTGDIQISAPTQHKGKSITVEKKENPENFYTCTLKNAASESTSDRVYKRDLFKPSSGSKAGLIAGLVIFFIIILLIIACIAVYLRKKSFRKCVNESCPCIESVLSHVNCLKKQKENGYDLAAQDQNNAGLNQSPDTTPMDSDGYVDVNKERSRTAGQVNMDEDACNPAPQEQRSARGNPNPDTEEGENDYENDSWLKENGNNKVAE